MRQTNWKYIETISKIMNGDIYEVAKTNTLFVDIQNCISKNFGKDYWIRYLGTSRLYIWSINL